MKELISLKIGTVSSSTPVYAIPITTGGVSPSPSFIGALVPSTSIVGALVSSTSIIRSSGIVHLNHSELWYRPPQSEAWVRPPHSSELWYRPPHWLARVHPPASPRVDLVRVHSPSDPVMTSLFRPSITHSLAFLTMVRYWNQSHLASRCYYFH
jgi:hypothetical protein